MAYDEELAARIRDLADVAGPEVSEQKMFGGLAFLIAGNMAVAVTGEGGLMVRVDPDTSEELVADTKATYVVMQNRPMPGWLRIGAEHLHTGRDLAHWVHLGATRARALPPKP